jgi:hypothetical protein
MVILSLDTFTDDCVRMVPESAIHHHHGVVLEANKQENKDHQHLGGSQRQHIDTL